MSISGTPWKYEEKGFTIDLTHLSTSNFYPCMFAGLSTGAVHTSVVAKTFMHCQIVSRGGSSSVAYNANMLDFTMSDAGWDDTPKTLNIHKYACYDYGEKTIGCIGSAKQAFDATKGALCVWLRGGIIYDVISNFVPTVYEQGYQHSTLSTTGFIASVGTTTHGGTNSNMDIDWTPSDSEELVAWPVGSIFMSVSHTTAAQVKKALGGGTWQAWGTGRVAVGVDTNQSEFNTVEKTGGEKTHQLTVAELPSHTHQQHVQNSSGYGGGDGQTAGNGWGGDWHYANDTESVGSNSAHNNLQPYITCYFWKRIA